MGNVTKIIKFYFVNLVNLQIIVCAAVLLLHLLISLAVINLANTEGPAGVNDGVVICWMVIMGLIMFTPGFKYVLSQGVSRKRFFLAMSLNIVILAAILALLSTIFYVITLQIANVWMIYVLIYHNQSIPGIIAWEFALLLFLGLLCWFICLVYYVSDRKTKFLVSILPFVLASLLILFNALVNGAIGNAIGQFFITAMGLSGAAPSQYIGMASMLAASVIISVPIFLLLRRAQVKD
jgi:hypothetical protein